jgi:hypothetical protein
MLFVETPAHVTRSATVPTVRARCKALPGTHGVVLRARESKFYQSFRSHYFATLLFHDWVATREFDTGCVHDAQLTPPFSCTPSFSCRLVHSQSRVPGADDSVGMARMLVAVIVGVVAGSQGLEGSPVLLGGLALAGLVGYAYSSLFLKVESSSEDGITLTSAFSNNFMPVLASLLLSWTITWNALTQQGFLSPYLSMKWETLIPASIEDNGEGAKAEA